MKREKKSPLSLALLRAQVALHEASLELGRVIDLEIKIKASLKSWRWSSDKITIQLDVTPELLSILPSK